MATKEPKIEAIRILQSCRAGGKHMQEGHAFLVDDGVTYEDACELVKIGRAARCEVKDVKGINKNAAVRDEAVTEARQKVEQTRNELFAAQAKMRAATGEDAIAAARAEVDAAAGALAEAERRLDEATKLEV